MIRPRSLVRLVPLLTTLATLATINAAETTRERPTGLPTLPLAELQPGMKGEVWTVFQGYEAEPFEVEVTGVIENSLGPGKSMILCQLTDPRVQNMGAVAGMSGSPLYIEGRLAGALSYQVQRFETVRYAGFTPIDDLLEVRRIALDGELPVMDGGETMPAGQPARPMDTAGGSLHGLVPLAPVFTFGGLSPNVAALFSAPFAELGVQTTSLGGAMTPGRPHPEGEPVTLQPGQAVGAALAVGDITLAGTGTVSHVDGNRILAFGHPLMGLGTVEVPMTAAEIVTILPSNLSSFKISNTGGVIGTVRQDRLSAIYGEMGTGPTLVPITVNTPERSLHFATVKHPRLTPLVTASGLSQAVLGTNAAGLAEGFRIAMQATFPDGQSLELTRLFAGPKAFEGGLEALVRDLTTWLLNPVEEVFPDQVTFDVEPLAVSPIASLDNVQVSHREIAPGEAVRVTLGLRDFQSQPLREQIVIPTSPDWAGKPLEIVIAGGEAFDLLTGGQKSYPVSQIRDFNAYLDAVRAKRRTDGLYIAVVTNSTLFLDQTSSTLELPGSFARVAQQADKARFTEKQTREVLWETHVLPDRIIPGIVRESLRISD